MARRGLGIALVAVTLGLTACGGGGSGGSGGEAAPTNACDLLTTDEADDLLGVPTGGASEDTDRSSGTYCEWVSKDSNDDGDAASDDGEGGPSYFISVEDETGEDAVQGFESGRRSDESDDDEPQTQDVDGLGDDAYFERSGGLAVRSGARVFSVYVGDNELHPLTTAELRDIERRAAEIIVERIGDSGGDGGDLTDAQECGRSGRCLGSRFRACDLITDAEIQDRTGYVVERANGQIEPGESDSAGVCEYVLEPPAESDNTENRLLEIRGDDDADAAERQYREARTDAEQDDALEELPALGPDAFYSSVWNEVVVLHDGTFFTVSYEGRLPDGRDDTSPELVQTAIDLAAVAFGRAA
jgi:hypothetical protein